MNNIPPPPWAAWPIPNDRLRRYMVFCVNDEYCPGTGKTIVADNIRTKQAAELMAASREMYDELHRVLPFLEYALKDPVYRQSAVQERIKSIQAIIARVGAL